MNYKILLLIFAIFIYGCEPSYTNKSKKLKPKIFEKYSNSGFTLIYDDNLKDIKKIDSRSLNIYHQRLKRKSSVKITNPLNGKSLIAEVKSNKIRFSKFYNSVITSRIAEELELNLDEPYIQITLVSKNSTFIAKKSKTFDEEKKVAEKAPIDSIQINDLNNSVKKKEKKIKNDNFTYYIKVADFYYKDTANIMVNRIKNELFVKNSKIIKLSETKYRVLLGPFNDIKSIKESFEKMISLNFENLEILNDV